MTTTYRARTTLALPRFRILRQKQNVYDSVRATFPSALSQFVFLSRYSRYRYDLGRREAWDESVNRTMKWLRKQVPFEKRGAIPWGELQDEFENIGILPSNRLLAMAGPAADRDNTTLYNCSFTAVDSWHAFSEALLISMAGCGVAYSVEARHVAKLPTIAYQSGHTERFVIPDSAEGWGEAVWRGVRAWARGRDIRFDYSEVRPAGAILRTKGGRASGPGPLRKTLNSLRDIMLSAQGRQLTPLEAHDMMCHVGSAAVSGGMRRTAMLALFDTPDMRGAKGDDFFKENPQRLNANNSEAWPADRRLTHAEVRERVMPALGPMGEPGIFNRRAALRTMTQRRLAQLSPAERQNIGTNPCGEILLLLNQFCNLTASLIRPDDTRASLVRKAELAAIIGAIQTGATHFPALRDVWSQNAERERLSGVSPVGWMQNAESRQPETMEAMRGAVIAQTHAINDLLGHNRATATTAVKPAGNTSVMTGVPAGIHAEMHRYYVRRVELSPTDSLLHVLRSSGVPIEKKQYGTPGFLALFPVRAAESAIIRDEQSAVEQMDFALRVKQHFTEHNPSVTITFREGEEDEIVDYVYERQDDIVGMTFLKDDGKNYPQAPITPISREEYERFAANFPRVKWELLQDETQDNTIAAQTKSCHAGQCELHI